MRKNDQKVFRVFPSNKEIKSFVIDPDLETADIDISNNSWPKKEVNKFEEFKKKIQQ